MSIIATISLDAAEFVLGATVAANPDVRVRFERVVPVGERFVPYVWVADGDLERVEAALRAEAGVTSFRVVDTLGDAALIRVEWGERGDDVLDAMRETGATILAGTSEASRWRFQLRFVDHDDLSTFCRRCLDRDIAIELESVHELGLPHDAKTVPELTETQRETLRLALEMGYFDVPRRIDLGELGDELDVSDTAASQRLRRGLSNVLSEVLAGPGDGGTDAP